MHPKTTRITLQTRPAMSRTMLRGGREVAYGRGGISIQRHLAELQVKILSKHTFKFGVAILTSLLRDRYSSASRTEQRQVSLFKSSNLQTLKPTVLYASSLARSHSLDLAPGGIPNPVITGRKPPLDMIFLLSAPTSKYHFVIIFNVTYKVKTCYKGGMIFSNPQPPPPPQPPVP